MEGRACSSLLLARPRTRGALHMSPLTRCRDRSTHAHCYGAQCVCVCVQPAVDGAPCCLFCPVLRAWSKQAIKRAARMSHVVPPARRSWRKQCSMRRARPMPHQNLARWGQSKREEAAQRVVMVADLNEEVDEIECRRCVEFLRARSRRRHFENAHTARNRAQTCSQCIDTCIATNILRTPGQAS